MMIKIKILAIVLFVSLQALSQQNQDKSNHNQLMKYLAEAEKHFEKGEMAMAEAAYRKAISISPDSDLARYNFGNLYIDYKRENEALQNLNEASNASENKPLKHKSLHNQGNILMKKEKYAQAAKIYKEALKNDPSDDETRYNFALAKKLMKNQKQNQNNKDKNKKDQKKNKKKQKDKNKEGGKKQENQDNQSKKDKDAKDKSDKSKENKPKQDNKKDQNAKKNKEEKSEKQEKQKIRKAKLSPQQIKNILKAIENQEKKVQKKLNKKKQEGKPVKTDKDW
ncbi:MAG: tetratricopeptide repeat protein [Psychroflexus sp.]|nr:tetratricopeptide repeat protein [Psychroflexus sp.]MDR9447591.1 tetratricopeptide repeat protein [Psychroflexus sp.]